MHRLLEAVQNGETEKVEEYLNECPKDISFRDENGRELLSWAAQLGHLEIAKILIEKGATINAIENDAYRKETPLHNAIDEVHPEIVDVLLRNGADITLEDADGRNAIHILANIKATGQWDKNAEIILKLLLDHGADIDSVPLAAAFGSLQDVKDIVEKGGDISERIEHCEKTALHIAVMENNVDLVTYLLEVTEDIDCTDFNEMTPLDTAKNENIVSLLRRSGAKTSKEIWDEIYDGFASKNAAENLLEAIRKSNKSNGPEE